MSIERYRQAPLGACLTLPHAMVFCASPALWGFSLWGTPSSDDVARAVALIALDLGPQVAPHATLVDVRGLLPTDPHAFAPLIQHARSYHEVAATKVTRMAMVRPPGLFGMTVAGFFQIIDVPYPVRVFGDFSKAAAWAGASAIASALDATLRELGQTPSSLERLRCWLEAHVADASLERAARALGRSQRSLQRDLRSADSSFQQELIAARLQHAQRLLLDRRCSMTEIAHEVGCSSLQHFSTMFRQATGETPSEWRERRR